VVHRLILRELHELRNGVRMPEDHDILIQVHTIQAEMFKDLKELKNGTNARLTILEKDKVEKEEFLIHEAKLGALDRDKADQTEVTLQNKRLSRLERLTSIGVGLFLAVELILRFLFKV